MSPYFPKLHEHSCGNVKVVLHWSNYATKAYLELATGVDTSNLASKSGLAKVDEIDIDKLKIVLADLSKPINVVNNDVNKNSVDDKFITKSNANLIKINSVDTKAPSTSE